MTVNETHRHTHMYIHIVHKYKNKIKLEKKYHVLTVNEYMHACVYECMCVCVSAHACAHTPLCINVEASIPWGIMEVRGQSSWVSVRAFPCVSDIASLLLSTVCTEQAGP